MKISVVIPVFNAANYLERSVNSAASLKAVDEIILVNDASTDNSLAVCQHLVQSTVNVRLIALDQNLGSSFARNIGMQNSRNRYVAFLDADDEYLPSRFDRLEEFFRLRPKIVGIGVPTIQVINNQKEGVEIPICYASKSGLMQAKSFIMGNSIHLNGLLLKKNKAEDIFTFDVALKLRHDSDLILNLLLEGEIYYHHRIAPAAKYILHGKNSVLNDSVVIADTLLFAAKWIFHGTFYWKKPWLTVHFLKMFLEYFSYKIGIFSYYPKLVTKVFLLFLTPVASLYFFSKYCSQTNKVKKLIQKTNITNYQRPV